jgi:hypothetical protein
MYQNENSQKQRTEKIFLESMGSKWTFHVNFEVATGLSCLF